MCDVIDCFESFLIRKITQKCELHAHARLVNLTTEMAAMSSKPEERLFTGYVIVVGLFFFSQLSFQADQISSPALMLQGPWPKIIHIATVNVLCMAHCLYLSNEPDLCWFLVDWAFLNCSELHMHSLLSLVLMQDENVLSAVVSGALEDLRKTFAPDTFLSTYCKLQETFSDALISAVSPKNVCSLTPDTNFSGVHAPKILVFHFKWCRTSSYLFTAATHVPWANRTSSSSLAAIKLHPDGYAPAVQAPDIQEMLWI